jgi:hypothetical protein
MAGSCGVKRCSLLNSPMIVKLPVISEWSWKQTCEIRSSARHFLQVNFCNRSRN